MCFQIYVWYSEVYSVSLKAYSALLMDSQKIKTDLNSILVRSLLLPLWDLGIFKIHIMEYF